MSIITLLTDFGHKDWYVASMKGCILSLDPHAVCVDITHEIPPGNIRSAAFILAQCYSDFPEQTVFLCVVDPGVGTERSAIAIRLGRSYLVGPDNGIFSYLVDREKDRGVEIHKIENESFFHTQPSHTFHGRDIFAPVSAHLAQGAAIADLGPRLEKIVQLNLPRANYQKREAKGEILFIDHFGNAITNFTQMKLEPNFPSDKIILTVGNCILPHVKTFGDVAEGEPLAYYGSGGFLEIALNGGSATEKFNLHIEQKVEIKLS
jgi:hypothetical protein